MQADHELSRSEKSGIRLAGARGLKTSSNPLSLQSTFCGRMETCAMLNDLSLDCLLHASLRVGIRQVRVRIPFE